jgi:hypothetical protein
LCILLLFCTKSNSKFTKLCQMKIWVLSRRVLTGCTLELFLLLKYFKTMVQMENSLSSLGSKQSSIQPTDIYMIMFSTTIVLKKENLTIPKIPFPTMLDANVLCQPASQPQPPPPAGDKF